MQGYCVKCQEKVNVRPNAQVVEYENNRRALVFDCIECGTKVNRMSSLEDIKKFKEKYASN